MQSDPSHDQAKTLSAVLAHHGRTGAAILAEGIEAEDHLDMALAVGASLGQGFMFGHAGALSDGVDVLPWTMPPRRDVVQGHGGSPFDLVAAKCPVRTARKNTLLAFSGTSRARPDMPLTHRW